MRFEPIFPNWHAIWREDRLNPTAEQAFFALRGACGRLSREDRADQTAERRCSESVTVFFSTSDRPSLPFSFGLGVDLRFRRGSRSRA